MNEPPPSGDAARARRATPLVALALGLLIGAPLLALLGTGPAPGADPAAGSSATDATDATDAALPPAPTPTSPPAEEGRNPRYERACEVGRAALTQRRAARALAAFRRAQAIDPKRPEAQLGLAHAHLLARDPASALRAAQAVLRRWGESAEALVLRAEARHRLHQDRAGVLRDIARALDYDPDAPRALGLRAYVRLARHPDGRLKGPFEDWKASQTDAERALKAGTGQVYAHQALAEVAWARRQRGAALRHASSAVELSRGSPEAHLLRARLRIRDADLKGADADCDAVLARVPAHPIALANKASIAYGRGQVQQALLLCDQALEGKRDLPGVLLTKGMIHMRTRPRNFRKAIDLLSQAIRLDPECGDAYFQRALCFHDTLRFGDALRDLERAQALVAPIPDGTNTSFARYEVALFKGHCLYRREQYAEAAAEYRRYLLQAPPTHRALKKTQLRLRELLHRLGEQPKPPR